MREHEYLRRAAEAEREKEQESPARRKSKALAEGKGKGVNPEDMTEEDQGFQKLFEQQERERRHAEREEKQKSIASLGSNASKRNQGEVLRYEQTKAEEYERLARQEEARLARDTKREEEARETAEANERRVDLYERLEGPREARAEEREATRLETTLHRSR